MYWIILDEKLFYFIIQCDALYLIDLLGLITSNVVIAD